MRKVKVLIEVEKKLPESNNECGDTLCSECLLDDIGVCWRKIPAERNDDK